MTAFGILRRTLKLWILLAGCSVLRAQQPPRVTRVDPEALHGTVNVFLGNRNGLVVATDSRLSYKGERRGLGQKLFRIDDHSVCAIAGFYSDSGPDVGLQYPIATTVPGIIDTYIHANSSISTYSIEAKLDGLAQALIVSLQLVENLNMAAGQHPSPSVSQITVAGFDHEVLKVAHLDLVPSLEGNNAVYRETNLSVDTVGQDFFWKLAGIEDVGRAMLGRPDLFIATNPAAAFYARAIKTDHGRLLSLSDIEQLANDVEYTTAKLHPAEVGGPLQSATLSAGKILKFEQPNGSFYLPPASGILESIISNAFRGIFAIGPVREGIVRFIAGSTFENIGNLPIDNTIFVGNKFKHCRITFRGAIAMLDGSNSIGSDSVLDLAPKVRSDNPVVAHIRRSFPNLAIRQSKPSAAP